MCVCASLLGQHLWCWLHVTSVPVGFSLPGLLLRPHSCWRVVTEALGYFCVALSSRLCVPSVTCAP